MSEWLRHTSCGEFTALLASSAPAPGGGGAAALMGALAASLCSMAAVLTAGRKKYADVKGELDEIVSSAQTLREKLLELIDADAEGFRPLAAAYSLPKDGSNYAEIMRAATLTACEAPMEILRRCCEAVDLLERTLEIGSPALISDVGCGAAACRAAMESAAMNVFINTRTLKGDGAAEALEKEAAERLNEYIPRVQTVADRAMAYLRR